MHERGITRRDSLVTMGAAAAGAAMFGLTSRPVLAADAAPVAGNRKRALRVAHITDIHVQPEKRGGEGMASCLQHVGNLHDKPTLVLSGGDHIMDSFEAEDARTQLQWDLWSSVLKNDCGIPVRSCIGNHDIWGWGKSKSKTTGKEPKWGKARAMDMLHMDERYYTFTQDGWRFIILDGVQHHPTSDNYTAYIDDEQFDWLERTLKDTPANEPVLILSHIPILSATSIVWSQNKGGSIQVGNWIMHGDCVKLKELFDKHPQVKICLSGHTHLRDRTEYNGVTYLCDGAVCGSWWGGRYKDCDEGYAILDLYNDGTFDHEYVKYGWKAQPEVKKA